MHPLWKRLFQRKTHRHELNSSQSAIPPFFLVVVGQKRSRLTIEDLCRVEEETNGLLPEFTQPLEDVDDRSSVVSFFTCVSTFEDQDTNETQLDLRMPLLGASHAFGHYISHKNLKALAMEALDKMNRHFEEGQTYNDEDAMGKYLCPGLGWEVHPDEVGPRVLTVEHMKKIAGYWKNDVQCGDDPAILVDVMEMPWVYKKAARLVQYSEIYADDEKISMYPKVLGISFKTVSYWTREGRLTQRRDMRKGISRVSTVLTTFGFRQYVQWGQPYAGFAVVEGQISQDFNSFESVTYTQRYDGPHCCLRSVFRRVIQ